MSAILKGNILGTGQLEQEIFNALNSGFGCSEYSNSAPQDPCEAQQLYAKRLANAISEAVSKGVQQYLAQTVKTINLPTLVAPGPAPHVHPNVPQYNLLAP